MGYKTRGYDGLEAWELDLAMIAMQFAGLLRIQHLLDEKRDATSEELRAVTRMQVPRVRACDIRPRAPGTGLPPPSRA